MIQGVDDHVNTEKRITILKKYFDLKGIDYKIINSVEGTILEKIINLIYVFDYSTIYTSILNNTDPSPVNSIDFIKSKL